MIKIADFFLLFFYVFSTQFIFVPGNLGTRVLIGVWGMYSLFIHHNDDKFKNRTIRNFRKYLLYLVPLIIFSILTMIINGTSDFEFIKYSISMILVFFASYYVANRLIVNSKYNIFSVIDLLKYVVIVHLLISICAFVFLPFQDVIIGIQALKLNERSDYDYILSARLVGLGPSFFVAGIIYCCTLVLITFKLLFMKMSSFEITKDVISFLFIILFGVFTSRMIILGLALSILLFVFSKRKTRQNTWKVFFPVLLLIIPLTIFVYINTIYNNPEMEKMVHHGYEMLQNVQDKGEASSASTNHLMTMYETYPSEVGTLLYGDGHFTSLKGDGYYKDIDIGYYRLVFYFGVFGTFFYFLFQYKVLSLMRRSFRHTKLLTRILFILVIVLNFKGFADIASIVLLFSFNES